MHLLLHVSRTALARLSQLIFIPAMETADYQCPRCFHPLTPNGLCVRCVDTKEFDTSLHDDEEHSSQRLSEAETETYAQNGAGRGRDFNDRRFGAPVWMKTLDR